MIDGALPIHAKRAADITDGLSQTAILGECPDYLPEESGYWVSGQQTLVQIGSIGSERSGLISWHSGGAFVAFADGSVHFFSNETDVEIVRSLCTCSGREGTGLRD